MDNKNDNNSEYILNEVNKGIKMGMDSISTISEKVQDAKFKEDLQFQYNKYNDILNKVNDKLADYGEFPKELNPMQKTMGWISIEMQTFDDKSDSKISEMMLNGTNMGIIKGVKLYNHNPDCDPDIRNILDEFIKFQENTVEQLKKYL